MSSINVELRDLARGHVYVVLHKNGESLRIRGDCVFARRQISDFVIAAAVGGGRVGWLPDTSTATAAFVTTAPEDPSLGRARFRSLSMTALMTAPMTAPMQVEPARSASRKSESPKSDLSN